LKGVWLETDQKRKNEKAFDESGGQGGEKLSRRTLEIEATLEELNGKEDHRPCEGVEAEGVSGKQVREVSEDEGQNPA